MEVDGKMGLFRGLSPRIISSVLSTINREQVKKVQYVTYLFSNLFVLKRLLVRPNCVINVQANTFSQLKSQFLHFPSWTLEGIQIQKQQQRWQQYQQPFLLYNKAVFSSQ